ncbi:IS5 family transposase [Caballeronia sp. INDeC2]|uniref:IS5 family transposase n=1 Tax=Caballeronia sp. INDeC2 TaxID=2921747 RepID=UPI0020288A0C|nr:IS5 family transposase [Caballeronia sp. INDeC2]
MLPTDEIWELLECIVPGKPGDVGRHGADNRLFVEAVLWIARTGSPWRDLPKEFARWHTAYIRFPVAAQRRLGPRGSCAGTSGRTRTCADRLDRHPSTPAFGRSAEKNGPQALGRSRGGLSTKIHLAVDSRGRALRLILTEGQVADIACAQDLVDGLRCKAVIADKGYDSDAFVKGIRASRAKAVIPPRSNRKIQRRYDRTLYRQRNLVERFHAHSFDPSTPP